MHGDVVLQLTTAEPGSGRVVNRVGESRMIAAHALQALLPGSTLPYYGDEIAMVSGAQVSIRSSSGATSPLMHNNNNNNNEL